MIPTPAAKAPSADDARRDAMIRYIIARDRSSNGQTMTIEQAKRILGTLPIAELTRLELAAMPRETPHQFEYDPFR